MDFYSAAKKLRVNRLLLNAAALVLRGGGDCLAADEARKKLHEFFPRRDETALRVPPRRWPAPECDVTVIIPTYNNAAQIGETVRSVLTQKTDARLEALVINDGSTDDTAQKLAALTDERLRVIAQENRGVSEARNAGVDMARGAYILFLDGDDILLPGAIDALMRAARRENADLVQGGYDLLTVDGALIRRSPGPEGVLQPMAHLNGFPWGKLMRRECMAGLRFPGRVSYEDSVMLQLLAPLLRARQARVYGIAQPVVGYRVNPQGFSQTYRGQPKSVDTVWITDILRADRARLGLTDTAEDYEHLLDMAALSARRTACVPREIRRAVFAMYRDYALTAGKGFATRRREQAILEKALRGGNERLFTLAARLG